MTSDNLEYLVGAWRKSSRSGATNCVEAAPLWRKSSRSGQSNCVEAAPLTAGVGLRDSKRPAQPHLAVRPTAWASFTRALKADRLA